MTAVDAEHQPVVVGVHQISRGPSERDDPVEPYDLMVAATRGAIADCGVSAVASRVDAVNVLRGFWSYRAAASQLAAEIGAPAPIRRMSPPSGTHAQLLINDCARRIATGEVRAALVVGGEAVHSARTLAKQGMAREYTDDGSLPPDELVGESERIRGVPEGAAGIELPAPLYAMIESALRAADGLSIDEHRTRTAELYAELARVAAANPHAWSQHAWTPDELLAEGAGNRMFTFPYTTRLVSQWNVDQAAAVLLCSAGEARALGVEPEKWVHLHSGTDTGAALPVSERDDITRRHSVRRAGHRALELAGITTADLAHVDLYSCFPSAVHVQARELGIPLSPFPSVTGGLAFAGGPVNSYALHSFATMTERLRAARKSHGFVSSVAGVVDKQSFTVMSTAAPAAGFVHEDLTAACAEQGRAVTGDADGDGVVLGATVVYEPGDTRALLLVEMDDGTRTIVTSREDDVIEAVETTETVGRRMLARRRVLQ